MSSKTNKESSRMSSIARSINMEFWIREFSHMLVLDMVIIGLAVFAFIMWREDLVPEGQTVASRYLLGTENYETLEYVIETETGVKYAYLLHRILDLLKTPAIILGAVEVLILIGNFFGTSVVRKKMQPLNEVAIRTEELSSMSAAGGAAPNLKSMEKAISTLDPEQPGAKVTTGDKELQSLEIAINNLLERMRESHRQQERFVSDASHELRTPIAVIQGYVNMLDRWGKDDEQVLKESIEALKNESEHMKNLVEQLLFLARGDSGRNTLHIEDVNLTEMVSDVMEESVMIDAKHIYKMAGTDTEVRTQGDAAMLKQALRIFVQNAAKYSKDGDTITLRVGMTEGAPFYSVQDEGVGMASSEVVHVFERFYRSDSARNSSEGGTGLGLSIAKWIVDAHGGVIEILSRPEFGSRITVKLPDKRIESAEK